MWEGIALLCFVLWPKESISIVVIGLILKAIVG